ncbi:MAG TPA: recombinase family protein [Anaerovoracaceae bacterium]|nr:recombinase family protein [Anaerovoracaceae bacterium]
MKNEIAAIYCRLSKEDIDKALDKTVSESIKNQKSMLEAYALEHQWLIYDFYIDEDYSGSDRGRPEFNRLITDSLLGRFNIVLCKKQARFARDIEYVEKYIHGLFAEKQIRFVAVLDNIDTGAVGRSVRKASQINSLVDEWYLSDLSENIISSLTIKRKNAEFIGSWAPYGYRKDPNNKNSLTIDPEAAEIVKEIFGRYLNGYGISRIAQELNAGRIPNPLLYKQSKGERINPNPEKLTVKRYLWAPSTVSAILHNQTYIGYLIQGKYRKANYKSKKLLRVPRTDWIIIPECHECIIDRETWDEVQKSLNSKWRVSAAGQCHHLLAGKAYCGECGSKLVSSGGRSGYRKTSYLCCSNHNLSKDACIGTRIEASKLEQVLLNQINSLAGRFYDEDYLIKHIDFDPFQPDSRKAQLKSRLQSLQDRTDTVRRKKDILYSDKLDGLITFEQYLEFKIKLEEESESILLQQQELTAEISFMEARESDPVSKTDIMNHFRDSATLTQEMVNQLMESVYVFKRKKGEAQQVIINWDF